MATRSSIQPAPGFIRVAERVIFLKYAMMLLHQALTRPVPYTGAGCDRSRPGRPPANVKFDINAAALLEYINPYIPFLSKQRG